MNWNNNDVIIPDGKYQVKVNSVELTHSKISGNLIFKWVLKILGPTHKGHLLWRNNVIASKEDLHWLKQDLYTICELQMGKLSELLSKLEALLGVELEVIKHTRNKFENIYFSRRIVRSDDRTGRRM